MQSMYAHIDTDFQDGTGWWQGKLTGDAYPSTMDMIPCDTSDAPTPEGVELDAFVDILNLHMYPSEDRRILNITTASKYVYETFTFDLKRYIATDFRDAPKDILKYKALWESAHLIASNLCIQRIAVRVELKT